MIVRKLTCSTTLRNLILVYGLGLLLLACTHNTIIKSEDQLYNHYKGYAGLLNKSDQYNANQLDQIFSSLTPRKQAHLLSANHRSPELLATLIDEYLTFPFWLAREYSHYELRNGDDGCLLLNGYNEKLEPIAITISYHNEQQWLIDDLYVEHLAPFNKFLSRAICDKRKLDEIRYQEML
ncbi:MAG: hypothetical protein R3240_01255 [Gammaproteobacteria bacterium]|nr:hypothetical protein [Gammaproteobacteria bacterium]